VCVCVCVCVCKLKTVVAGGNLGERFSWLSNMNLAATATNALYVVAILDVRDRLLLILSYYLFIRLNTYPSALMFYLSITLRIQ